MSSPANGLTPKHTIEIYDLPSGDIGYRVISAKNASGDLSDADYLVHQIGETLSLIGKQIHHATESQESVGYASRTDSGAEGSGGAEEGTRCVPCSYSLSTQETP